MVLMLVAVMGAGVAFAENTARNVTGLTGNGAGMTGTGYGTVGTLQVTPTPYVSPTPNYVGTGAANIYNRNNGTYGTNPYGTGIRTNTYRARATTNGNNWGWLGLLGLFGLAGLRNRNERTVDDRSKNRG